MTRFSSMMIVGFLAFFSGGSDSWAQSQPSTGRAKVLVVDDSATVRQQVNLALVQAGFAVVEAVDGVDGMDKLRAVPSISVVICDVNMPRMNGLDFLEQARADARFASIPVVMLTTEGQPVMVERAKKAGAKGWLIKPFKAELLVAAVRKLASR